MTSKKSRPRFSVPELGRAEKRRPAKVGDTIRKEIALLLVRKLKDPRLFNVTITDVQMTPDLRTARVYYGCSDEKIKEVHAGLDKAQGFIRSSIARNMSMRFIPKLVFIHDLSMARHEEMEKLFREIENERQQSSE